MFEMFNPRFDTRNEGNESGDIRHDSSRSDKRLRQRWKG